MKNLFLLFGVLFLISCNKEATYDLREDMFIVFYPRQCNYVWLHNVYDDVVYRDGSSYFDYYSYLESENKVSFDKYVLELSTCNVSWSYILWSI